MIKVKFYYLGNEDKTTVNNYPSNEDLVEYLKTKFSKSETSIIFSNGAKHQLKNFDNILIKESEISALVISDLYNKKSVIYNRIDNLKYLNIEECKDLNLKDSLIQSIYDSFSILYNRIENQKYIYIILLNFVNKIKKECFTLISNFKDLVENCSITYKNITKDMLNKTLNISDKLEQEFNININSSNYKIEDIDQICNEFINEFNIVIELDKDINNNIKVNNLSVVSFVSKSNIESDINIIKLGGQEKEANRQLNDLFLKFESIKIKINDIRIESSCNNKDETNVQLNKLLIPLYSELSNYEKHLNVNYYSNLINKLINTDNKNSLNIDKILEIINKLITINQKIKKKEKLMSNLHNKVNIFEYINKNSLVIKNEFDNRLLFDYTFTRAINYLNQEILNKEMLRRDT